MYTVNKTEKNGSVTRTSFPRFAMAWSYARSVGGVVDVANGSEPEESFEVTNCDSVMVERRRIFLASRIPTAVAPECEEVFASGEEEEEAPATERNPEGWDHVSGETDQAAE